MPRKKTNWFTACFDKKGNLWVQGEHMKRIQEWIKRGIVGTVKVQDESANKKKRSKK